jgi:hypothetical protein
MLSLDLRKIIPELRFIFLQKSVWWRRQEFIVKEGSKPGSRREQINRFRLCCRDFTNREWPV